MTLVRTETADTRDGIHIAGAIGSAFLDYYRSALADPATPSRALELCRIRYGQILDATDAADGTAVDPRLADAVRAHDGTELSDDDRTFLHFGEQFLLDPQRIDDELAADVRGRLGDRGFVAFVLGIGLVEQYLRMAVLLRGASAARTD